MLGSKGYTEYPKNIGSNFRLAGPYLLVKVSDPYIIILTVTTTLFYMFTLKKIIIKRSVLLISLVIIYKW